ncbi:hypothetical protein OG21DRAFT_1481301 [Imleria badia]|nr:hypothetical protein OG21DRAFT_1481301 [Imleria badia]
MLRLARLPPTRAALDLHCAAPGHANPHFLDRARFLDPSHPAAALSLRAVPAFVCPQFTLRAFPNAILTRPIDHVPINPLRATDLVRRPCLSARGKRISLLFHTSKKTTSKSCVVRRRLRTKITAAIALVVTRNADVPAPKNGKPRIHLVSRSPQESAPPVLQDWTYLVVPDLAIYKTPLPNLIQVVRKALVSVSHQATRLEASWSALPKQKLRPPHKVVDKSAIRTRTSERAQGSDTPVKHPRISTRLYSGRPVILQPKG